MNSLGEARATIKADDFSFDEEIRLIFVDEAVEVLQSMDELLPQWLDDPSDFTTLKEIRRGFHTLKGSGRMVGANAVGELAWAIENLLNRVLLDVVPISEDLLKLVNETKYIIPFLVHDFANQEPPSSDPATFILKAENLRLQRDVHTGLDIEEIEATEPEPIAQVPPPVKIVSHDDEEEEEFASVVPSPVVSNPVESGNEQSNPVIDDGSPADHEATDDISQNGSIENSSIPESTEDDVDIEVDEIDKIEQVEGLADDSPSILTDAEYKDDILGDVQTKQKQVVSDVNRPASNIDKKIIFWSLAIAIIILLALLLFL